MSTLTRKDSSNGHSLFHANPILNRLTKISERSDSQTATYAGIAAKTTFFLLMTLVGIIVQLIVTKALASEPVWQTITVYENFTLTIAKNETIILVAVLVAGFISELLGIFVQRTVPVTGTLYSISQGYVISFLVFKVLHGYEHLGLEALLLTIVVVGVMCWMYTAGIIKGGSKYRAVLLALMLGSIGFALIGFLGSLIPFTRPYVQAMMQNTALTITLDVIGLVIAALFLISDFSLIDTCVTDGYPKKYEWYAAFGLVFTVLWIYMKILDLLIQIAGKKEK